MGVLNGAERFDSMKGYKFSTYVRYWIKKSILALIERHKRGIQIPVGPCLDFKRHRVHV